jgi:RNA polymerase sigma-70 factor (ECF subfamily)
MIDLSERRSERPPESPAQGADAALAAELAERRAGAFERLVAVYQDRLYGLAYRLTLRSDEAEEVAQDALLRAHRALYERYGAEQVRTLNLRAWLFSITLNVARNRLRRRRATVSLDELPERVIDRSDGRPSALELAEQGELRARLGRELARLPQRQREALALRFMEDLPYAEAAALLERPVGTVKSDVHRGLRRLRGQLGDLLDERPAPASREGGWP